MLTSPCTTWRSICLGVDIGLLARERDDFVISVRRIVRAGVAASSLGICSGEVPSGKFDFSKDDLLAYTRGE